MEFCIVGVVKFAPRTLSIGLLGNIVLVKVLIC
jgi:hypothetical protein